MDSKRQLQHEGDESVNILAQLSKRRREDSQRAGSCIIGNLRLNIQTDIVPRLASMAQRVVHEVVESKLVPSCGLSLNRQIGTPGGTSLQLCFMNDLLPSISTQSKITAKDGSPLQMALCDATFQHRKVKEDVPSMKIRLCVLKGDFGSNGSEDWTAEEFNANILRQREGKPELLSGDTVVTLKNGVGCIKNVVFTDNSRWTRSGTFRIGLKIVQSCSIGTAIKEGISGPLRVKDKRCMKHDRPSLNDEVWRLQKIGKDGPIYKQLSSNGIETVKDLLQFYTIDQASLRQKIGNVVGKPWDTIIEHAKACKRDDNERYTYQYFIAGQSISLVFNCIYEVVKVAFNGQDARSLKSLNLEEQRLVEIAKQQAYNNLKDLKPIETTPHSLARTLAAVQYGAPYRDLQQFDLPIAQQGQPQTWQNLSQPFTSTTSHNSEAAQFPSLTTSTISHVDEAAYLPYLSQPSTSTASHIEEAAHSYQVGSSQLQDQFLGVPLNWPAGEQRISGAYIADSGWPIIGGSPMAEFESCFVTPTPWEPLCLPCDYGVESSTPFPNPAVHILSNGKRKTLLNIFRSAVTWVILHAAKRKAKVFHYQY